MFSTITAATALAIGTRVEAVYFDGTPVVGTIASRDWWFENLMFYVVREDANGRRYADVPEYHIYPERDAIRPA